MDDQNIGPSDYDRFTINVPERFAVAGRGWLYPEVPSI